MFDFSNDDFRKISGLMSKFSLGGTPILAPQSPASLKMTTPALPVTSLFLLQNPFPLKKCGCLQQTRAQSVKIWPRYKGFKLKRNSQKFSFFCPVNEKRRKSAGFQDKGLTESLHDQSIYIDSLYMTRFASLPEYLHFPKYLYMTRVSTWPESLHDQSLYMTSVSTWSESLHDQSL